MSPHYFFFQTIPNEVTSEGSWGRCIGQRQAWAHLEPHSHDGEVSGDNWTSTRSRGHALWVALCSQRRISLPATLPVGKKLWRTSSKRPRLRSNKAAILSSWSESMEMIRSLRSLSPCFFSYSVRIFCTTRHTLFTVCSSCKYEPVKHILKLQVFQCSFGVQCNNSRPSIPKYQLFNVDHVETLMWVAHNVLHC